MATQTQVRRIDIKINTDGDSTLRKIASGFSSLNKSIDRGTSTLTRFQNAFLAIQSFRFLNFGLENLVQSLDSVQKLQTRLESLEGSAQAASKTFAGLVQVANANFTSIQDLGVVYNRLGQSLKETGISSSGILAITDTLAKSFRLSGSTAAEATSSVIQLSQGLASGQLRGAELRSVLEQNAVVGELLAKQLGTTRGELLKFAEKAGGIKAGDFLQALAKGAEDLNASAEKLRPTITESLTKNINILEERLAKLNEQFGITEKVVSAIDFTFKNLSTILTGLAVLIGPSAIGGAITALGKAGAFLSVTFAKIVASPIIGFLGVFAAKLATLVALAGGWPVVLAGALASAGVYFAGILLFSERAQQSFKIFGERITDVFKTSRRRAAEMAESQREFQKSIKTQPIAGITVAFTDWDKAVQGTINTIKNGEKPLSELEKAVNVSNYKNGTKVLFDFKVELAKLNAEYANTKDLTEYNKKLKELKIQDLSKQLKEGAIDKIEYNKRLNEIDFGKLVNNVRESSDVLRALNAEFRRTGNIGKFAEGFRKLKEARIEADVSQGSTDAITAKLEKNSIAVEKLNAEYATGILTLERYNFELDNLKIEEITTKLKAGTISLNDYYQALTRVQGARFTEGFNAGLSQYITNAGTLASNFASAVTNTFDRLEASLFEFIKTGKFEFNKFTQAILDDLLKIAIRQQIIIPLANAFLPASPAKTQSQGGVFSGANYFADGGVVSGRTSFLYGGGMKRGVMGEAGPEAILPLQRDSQGKLGVASTPSNVTVNVVNNANNTEIEQRERTDPSGARILDVIIVNKVKEGLSSGFFDKQFESQYGLRRRGV